MKITIDLSEDDYPELFNKDNIINEITNLLTIGYNIKYHTNNDNIKIDLLCRKFKDDIVSDFSDKTRNVTNEIDKLNSKMDQFTVNEKMDQLSNVLGKLLGISMTSNKKGQLSEDFIYNIITNKFKDYCYIKTRNINHHGDGELHYPCGLKALVEIKNYTKPVHIDELEKFKFDMFHTGINFGLFISLQSGIIRHKNMAYEKITHNDKIYHIVYIPNVLEEASKIEAGIIILERLWEIYNNIGRENSEEIKILQETIMDYFREIETVCDKTSKLKDRFINMENMIKGCMDDYYCMFRDYEYELKNKVNSIWDKILVSSGKSKVKLISDDLMDNIANEMALAKDKCYTVVLKVFDLLKKNNVVLTDKWELIKEGKEIGIIKKMKKKVMVMINSITISLNYRSNEKRSAKDFEFLDGLLEMH